MTSFPFTFYWSDETETTFNASTMNVCDEDIISFVIKHDEGQIPTLDIVVKNPRIGLLAPGRKVWAWFGWLNENVAPAAYQPLFFGVLVGVPTSLFQEKVTLKFIARSPDFIQNKQALAETMKTAPYYDPIWLETGKRDDPDTILEAWSALWHIDRLTNVITHSDILTGEDGTLVFTEADALYDSVSLTLGQPPLTNIRVEATTNWTQRSSGFITDIPPLNISSYTGDTLMSDWPKPGAAIGGGYKCEASYVIDTYLLTQTPTFSYNSAYTSGDTDVGQCGVTSASSSSSGPALLDPNYLSATLTEMWTTGVCFPDSDPPKNTPAHITVTGMIVPQWNLSMSMTLRYDSSRQYSEVLAFDMTADTQAVLSSPTVSQDTELITLSSVDVGQPLLEVEAWDDFLGQSVALAQIIFPNNPTTPGGLAYQICVTAGTAGTTEPVFSDIVGTTTADNSVVWASMGGSPLTTAPKWSPASFVPLGQIILLQNQVFNPATGDFEDIPGEGVYYICTSAGQTNSTYTEFSYTPPVVSNVEVTPAVKFINYIKPPAYVTSVGAQVADSSSGGEMALLGAYPIGGSGEGVTWTVLGTTPALLGIPIGGTADTVTANSYFPTARGLQSVEYLISKARARLRFRARAVTVGWDCLMGFAAALTCRWNATLSDPRFPGGSVTGKITSYSMTGDGNGKVRGHVEIGCAVGFGNSINEITGTPEYASPGYMQVGYQVYDGATVAHGSGETTYTLPQFGGGFDDGLIFPLTWSDISDGGLISGSLAEQEAAITASFVAARILAWDNAFIGTVVGTGGTGAGTTTSGLNPQMAWYVTQEELALASQNTPYVMAANSISWTALLKPCSGNGPFGGSYNIIVSPLVIPMGINLEAPSSP
jgi:hypothetical protein